MADYQTNRQDSEQENVGLPAPSADPLDKAKEPGKQLKLDVQIGYRPLRAVDAEKIGAFWEERRKIIHATNFVLDPKGKVVDASYSNGSIGRIVAADALSHIQFFKKSSQ